MLSEKLTKAWPWWRLPLIFVAFDIGLRLAMAFGDVAWRGWPPGDAHDIGSACALLAFVMTQPRRKRRV